MNGSFSIAMWKLLNNQRVDWKRLDLCSIYLWELLDPQNAESLSRNHIADILETRVCPSALSSWERFVPCGVCFCLILSNQMLSGGYGFQMLYSSTVRKYSNFAFDSWNIHLEPGSMIDIMVVCFWTYLLAKFISLALGCKTSADLKSSKNIASVLASAGDLDDFIDLFFDNFIPCLFCGLKLQHVKATPPFAALNSSTVDCLGPHWWRLGRSARQPRVSKWFHLNMHIIAYLYIYIHRCTYLNHLNHQWLLTLGFTHSSLMPISKELFGYRLGRWSLMIAIDII